MKAVLPTYTIKENVNALLPGRSTDYNTIVLTPKEKFYIRMSPLEIIKESCSKSFLTYEGSSAVIRKKLGIKYKVPLPINTALGIYAFPTMSSTHRDCIWLFYHRIEWIEDISQKSKKFKSKVHFIDGTSLSLTVSTYTLNKQSRRVKQCIDKFEAEQTLS